MEDHIIFSPAASYETHACHLAVMCDPQWSPKFVSKLEIFPIFCSPRLCFQSITTCDLIIIIMVSGEVSSFFILLLQAQSRILNRAKWESNLWL